jgi:glycine C-acetyltransferase
LTKAIRKSDAIAAEVLERARQSATLRALRTFESAPAARMMLDGRELIVLASNNYLDLAGHPDVVQAAQRAASEWGCAAGGSRLITGTLRCHCELEEELAAFLGEEAALVFSTGYSVNTGAIPALVGEGDVIFSDALVHASIIDGAKLSGASVVVFPHADVCALEERIREARKEARRLLIAVDGVYSMDGDLAPLRDIMRIARDYDAMTIVDDAHGIGCLGTGGRGSVELAEVLGQADLLVGTLGKALGSFGAFVACSSRMRELLINTARSFIFSCALAPPQLAAARAGLRLITSEPWRRQQLRSNAANLRARLSALGLDTAPSTTHIIPIVIGKNDETMTVCEALLERGFFVQGIRYPSVPAGKARLRITPMATHSDEELELFVQALKEIASDPTLGWRALP